MKSMSQLRVGEFFRLWPEGTRGDQGELIDRWHEVLRVTESGAHVRAVPSDRMRVFEAKNEKVKVHGLEYVIPLAEPKKVVVPESSSSFSISACAFVFERTMTRPEPQQEKTCHAKVSE